MSLLSVRNLWVAPPAEGTGGRDGPRTPDGAVIRGFSLELGRGEWVALSGANGCGKTSLLLALAGLWPARSGALLLEGRDFGPGAPRQRRARVAVIMQDPSCQLVQPTVREELSFSALNLGRPEEQVARDLEAWSGRLGLAGELERDPQRLSAGRQQVVLLAAALIARPALLLADEPAAHLDAESRRRVLELVREEVERGLSAVWVTQDPRERSAADRTIDLTESGQPGRVAPPAAPGQPAEPLLTLEISPWDGTDGPWIGTPAEVQVPIARMGVTAVEGPNGAGKSVLLAVAAGLLQIRQVRVDRGPPLKPPPILAAQYPELEIFEERVLDEVVYAAVSRGVERSEAVRAASSVFERLGLDGGGFLARRTWGLSGGEKRLLSLAGAIIAPAALLALDEPTAGLDPGRRAALAGIIAESARDRAVLIASQDHDWLSGLALRRFALGEAGPPRKASSSQKTD
jgi:energy-coupling factor transporter ATP-binding protein EcfA2